MFKKIKFYIAAAVLSWLILGLAVVVLTAAIIDTAVGC